METKDIAHSFTKEYFIESRSILYLLVILCFSVQNTYGSTDITVRPYEIKFDYDDTSHDDDALTILDADGDETTPPEWKYSPSRNNNVAYIKSQTNRKIKVKFDSNCNDMHLIINLTVTSGTGLGEICNQFVCNYEDQDEITLTLDGSIPNNVDVRTFTWEWEIYAITNESGYCSATSTNYTTHTYYTLLSTPQAPMTEPWSSVLNYACSWASGESVEASVISSITNELYTSGVKWDGGVHYTRGSYTDFYLSDLIDDISIPGNVEMDCRDFANFLHVLTNSLGVSGKYNIIDKLSSPYNITYNYLLPANCSSINNGNWDFHQVGWFGIKVADASCKIDNDSNPSSSPNTWKLPVGDMALSTYLDKLSEDDLSSVGTGICTVW